MAFPQIDAGRHFHYKKFIRIINCISKNKNMNKILLSVATIGVVGAVAAGATMAY